MGLALEELENTEDFKIKENDIDIILDERIKSYMDTGPAVTVDYRETAYGSGFIVDSGGAC